jgi:hypothetical protein
MRRVVAMLLASVSNGAMSEEWIAVSHTFKGDITVYADQSTIHKEGNIVKIRTLGDFKRAEIIGDNNQVSSLEEQYEYDCKEQQMRRLYTTMHSGNMGRGDVVYSGPIHEEWQPIPSGSMNEQLWEFSCGKK